jgi:hypothetical protein
MATREQKSGKIFYGWWVVLAAGVGLSVHGGPIVTGTFGSAIQRNAGKRMKVHKSPDKLTFYARCCEYSIPRIALPSFARDPNGMKRCRWVCNVSCMLVGRVLMGSLAVA